MIELVSTEQDYGGGMEKKKGDWVMRVTGTIIKRREFGGDVPRESRQAWAEVDAFGGWYVHRCS